jgi:ferredoxin
MFVMIAKVRAIYFSPTGTTRRVVTGFADAAAAHLGAGRDDYDFSLPSAREEVPSFSPDELAVFGMPVYAGRVPNLLTEYVAGVRGGGALAVPISVFGNRDFDDALIELRDILCSCGFFPFAAAAFAAEHAFSDTLGAGRPDARDLEQARGFALRVADMIKGSGYAALSETAPVSVPGEPSPYRGYYMPRYSSGEPIDIRKVKPKTSGDCNDCGLCRDLCPMGSISRNDVREVPGVCIKCCACVKGCPQGAKRFCDAGFLYHKAGLEREYGRRADNALFP